jgi:hypothetical protein
LQFLRSIHERQIAVASTVPAFADESMLVWLASRSLSGEREGPPTRRFATTPADGLRETRERRLVSLTFASWNRVGEWLRRLESLRLVA